MRPSLGGSTAAAPSNAARAIVEQFLARYGSDKAPGCAAGVLFKGRVVFEGAVGTMDGRQVSRQIAEAYLGRTALSRSTAERQVAGRAIPADLSGRWESRQGFILSTEVDGDHLVASIAGEKHVMSFDPRQKEFVAASDGLRLVLRRRDQDIVELGWEGDRPNSFTRLRLPTPSPSGLTPYAGHFANDELNVQWNLVVSDGSLVITTPAGWRVLMTRAAPDRFAVGPWVLEFNRTSGGISGFMLHRERLWRLGFQRVGGGEK